MGFFKKVFKTVLDPFGLTSGLIEESKEFLSDVTGATAAKQSAELNRQANERAIRAEQVKAQRERVQAIRQARLANASALSAGVNAGVVSPGTGMAASTFSGAVGAFNTQVAANASFTQQLNQLNQQRLDLIGQSDFQAARAQRKSQQFQQAVQIAGSFV